MQVLDDNSPTGFLADAKAEAMAIFVEEVGEALQVIGKINRHGVGAVQHGVKYDNLGDFKKEVIDVLLAVLAIHFTGLLDLNDTEALGRLLDKGGRMNFHHVDQAAFRAFIEEMTT